MPRPRRSGSIRRLRPPKMTIACTACDVTWRGTPGDACWHCGTRNTTEAAPAQVKIVS